MKLELSFSRRFSVKLMYAFNSAAIFLPGHPYIESTTVLSDTLYGVNARACVQMRTESSFGSSGEWSEPVSVLVTRREYPHLNIEAWYLYIIMYKNKTFPKKWLTM